MALGTEVLSAIVTASTWDSWDQVDRDAYGGTRQYTSLGAWAAAQGGDLVSRSEIAVAEIYDDFGAAGVVTSSNTFGIDAGGSWSCDADNFPIIRAAEGKEYNHFLGTGARLSAAADGLAFISAWNNAYLRVEGLGLSSLLSTAAYAIFALNDVDIKFTGCTLFDINQATLANVANVHLTWNNCMYIYSEGYKGNFQYGSLNNCTLIAKLGSGPYTGQLLIQSANCVNVVCYNENPKISLDNYYSGTRTTCAQNDNGSAALPAGNLNGILQSDFSDYAAGNYSLPLGSILVDAGTDLSSDFTTDIAGTVRG